MRISGAAGLSLILLGGCALEPTASPQAAEASDPVCRAAAGARARDAAVNGYDALLQDAIRKDSYTNCVAYSKNSLMLDGVIR